MAPVLYGMQYDNTDRLARRKHHHHLTALQLGILLCLGVGFRIFLDTAHQFHAKILVGHLTATETQGYLDLVAVVKEAFHRFHFHVVIVIVDGRAHLDLLDLDDLLLFAGFGGLFLLLIFVFAVVHQFDHGRACFRRDFDQIESLFFGNGASFGNTDLAIFGAVVTDQQNRARENFLIDARAVFGWCGRLSCETSGYYDLSP